MVSVRVANTSAAAAVADVYLDFQGARHTSTPLNFAPFETKILSVTDLLGALNLSAAQVPEGGLSIVQHGAVPVLIAQGRVFDPATGFSTPLHFPDLSLHKASALHANGVPVGVPGTDSPYAGTGAYTPHIIARNLTGSAQIIVPSLEYPSASEPAQAALGSLTLAPYSTMDVPLLSAAAKPATRATPLCATLLARSWYKIAQNPTRSGAMSLNVPLRFVCTICFLLLPAWAAEPQLTIYNQNFAVVRVLIPLNLRPGENRFQFTDTTAYLEPTSVILRDPSGKHSMRILEQNYRADPVSSQRLLSLNEGKTIDFVVQTGDKTEIVQGKIIRSGYYPTPPQIWNIYNGWQGAPVNPEPIVEINGKLRMGLPGTPLFPALPDDTILNPSLSWVLETDQPGEINAEFSYVTSQMTWNADYNLVAPEEGDVLDLVGWVGIRNLSGKTFDNAHIKLMAGEVNKLQPGQYPAMDSLTRAFGGVVQGGPIPVPQVTEKPFEEYHLYELHHPTTLHDQETKQVEFVRASGVHSQRFYVYDGAKIDENQYRGWNIESIRQNSEYGTLSNPDVWMMREFVNSEANHLGIPLPAGRLRFYRQDSDGQLEFTGENEIRHTPRDETIRSFTGSAFDIKGERRRTDYHIDIGQRWVDESFEIKLRNHKKDSAVVRVVEHLYRGASWDIVEKSSTYLKTDAQTIEFQAQVPPDGEKTVTYKVHYTW
ncbi:MAG TPA: hypothetical protein VMO17_18705 [Terriglobia bacterium]|nr:hypothetical protein [Terriglobia bacterium]